MMTRASQILLPALITVLVACAASGRPAVAEVPGFTLAGSDVREDGGTLHLNARFDVHLSPEADDALGSGVPLGLEMQIRVLRVRRWWWDAEVLRHDLRKELRYHALSRRYVVLHRGTGERRTFFRRDAALNAWASITDHAMIRRSRLLGGADHELQLRARLDPDALPYPLRTVALVSPEWRLTSEWYTWPLDG